MPALKVDALEARRALEAYFGHADGVRPSLVLTAPGPAGLRLPLALQVLASREKAVHVEPA